jgi:hypothetical protein
MKKKPFLLIISAFFVLSVSCSRKTGCPPMNQEVKKDKHGMAKKPAQTRLFSKKSKIKYYKNTNTKMI